MIRRPPRSTLFPCTTLCRSREGAPGQAAAPAGARPSSARECVRGRRAFAFRAPRNRKTGRERRAGGAGADPRVDRKSTRLNSSHANISYAVFCLKKKTNHVATPADFFAVAAVSPLLVVSYLRLLVVFTFTVRAAAPAPLLSVPFLSFALFFAFRF